MAINERLQSVQGRIRGIPGGEQNIVARDAMSMERCDGSDRIEKSCLKPKVPTLALNLFVEAPP